MDESSSSEMSPRKRKRPDFFDSNNGDESAKRPKTEWKTVFKPKLVKREGCDGDILVPKIKLENTEDQMDPLDSLQIKEEILSEPESEEETDVDVEKVDPAEVIRLDHDYLYPFAAERRNNDIMSNRCPKIRCKKKFDKAIEVQQHLFLSHYNGKVCLDCGSEFRTVEALTKHNRVSHLNNEMDLCSKLMLLVKKAAINALLETGRSASIEGKSYECPKCSEEFDNDKQRSLHFLTCSKIHKKGNSERPLKCDICHNYSCSKNHTISDNGMAAMAADTDGRQDFVHVDVKVKDDTVLKCHKCHIAFESPDKLEEHNQVYHKTTITLTLEPTKSRKESRLSDDRVVTNVTVENKNVEKPLENSLSTDNDSKQDPLSEEVTRKQIETVEALATHLKSNQQFVRCAKCAVIFSDPRILIKHIKDCAGGSVGDNELIAEQRYVLRQSESETESEASPKILRRKKQKTVESVAKEDMGQAGVVTESVTTPKAPSSQKIVNCLEEEKDQNQASLVAVKAAGKQAETGRYTIPNRKRCNVTEAKKEGRYCKDCELSFVTIQRLKTHIERVHKGIHAFKCEKCNKSYADKGNLNRHNKTFHNDDSDDELEMSSDEHKEIPKSEGKIVVVGDNNSFQCDICDKSYGNLYTLKRHLRESHGKDKSEIVDVNQESPKSESEEKVSVFNGSQTFTCEICNKSYSNLSNLNRHIKINHRKNEDDIVDVNQVSPESEEKASVVIASHNFKCDFCDKSYVSHYSLKRHLRINHGEVRNDIVNANERVIDDFAQVDIVCNEEEEEIRRVESPVQVDIVVKEESFEEGEQFTNEIVQDSLAVPGFRTEYQVGLTSEEQPRWKCQYCSKMFRKEATMRYHIALDHLGSETFQCSICKQRFSTEKRLQQHFDYGHPKYKGLKTTM